MHAETIQVELDGASRDIAVNHRLNGDDLVLFVHGLGCSRETFQSLWQAPGFERCSLLVPDLLGFGDSEKPTAFSYTMEDQARIVAAMLERFSFKRLHLVAHSLGGAVALLLPEKLLAVTTSFVNVEGNLVPEDCGLVSRRTINVSFEEFESHYFPYFKTQFNDPAKHHVYLEQTTAHAFYESSSSLVAWTDSGELLEKFLALPCKKVYFHGERNSGLEAIKHLGEIPTLSIAESGHFMMNENAGAFYERLAEFLAM